MTNLKAQLDKYRKIIFFLIAVLFVLSVIFVSTNSRNSAVELVTETIETRDVEKRVSADGNLKGIDSRVVFFSPNLKLTEARFKVGDKVNRDDVVAVFNSIDGRNISSEVKAPISGVVTEYNYKQNDVVSAVNTAGATIVDRSSFLIELSVNENDIVDLQVGQTAEIVFPAISIDNTYSGVVESVSPDSIANSSTVSYKVVVKPTEMPDSLKLGMSANVEIITARVENVLSVPESYVVEKDDKFFLKFVEWKDDTKTAYDIVEKEVTIGLVTDEYTEIKSGVKEGDEIVEPSFEPQRLNLFGAP